MDDIMDKIIGDSRIKITKIGDDGVVTEEYEGNTFLDEGIKHIWSLVCGETANALTTDNAQVGVGNSGVSTSSDQLSLQGTSTYFSPVGSEYPVYGSTTHITLRGTFGVNDANFHWKEIGVSAGDILINRMVNDMGTKTDEEAWIVDVKLLLE